MTPAAPLEDGVLGMERERNERQKAAGLVLLLAEAQQMIDALLVRLDVAVQHGAVRRNAEPVRGVVRLEPEVGMLLARRDQSAHPVREDLGTAAGKRTQPGVPQRAQHLLVRQTGQG